MSDNTNTNQPKGEEKKDANKKAEDNPAEFYEEKKTTPLDDADIEDLKRYGIGPYADSIKKIEE